VKCLTFGLAAVVIFLSLSGAALAHKVNVYAFVDGDAIQIECSFSRSRKVKNGKLVITDLETGGLVLEGVTDGQGRFRFRPSEEFLQTGHGLNIRLLAGEGHQDEWKMSPEDLKVLSLSPPSSATESVPTIRDGRTAGDVPRQAVTAAAAGRTAVSSALDAAELEAVIGKVLDQKLAPIKQTLARQQGDDPGFRDVIGGIGWIIGLLGLTAYMKYRR
jgi:nickel transport protein